MVCRPVQREIDNQKNQGNNRVAKRARSTYRIFRQIIDSEEGFTTIRDSCPRVTLRLEGPSLPSQELEDKLDYSKPDDEIVGCLYRFSQDNPNTDARLLTHDGGPMMTAKSLNLPYSPISDSWILPPENNEEEKENARLRLEIDRLRKLEPDFIIRLYDESDQEINSIDVEYKTYDPLDDQEIEELEDLLAHRFPMVTNFGNSRKRSASTAFGAIEAITQQLRYPPSAKDIEDYKNRQYPAWVEDCKLILSSLHKALEHRLGRPSILISIENNGTRPGKDTLVEFRALGKFKISPPLDDFPDSYLKGEDMQIDLPPPPKPPKGRLLGEGLVGVNRTLDYPEILHSSFLSPPPAERDPNAFYYKHKFPLDPVSSFSLSCDQWRHGSGEEELGIEICLDSHTSQGRASIECVVQAENISSPVRKRFPITVNVVKMDTKTYAYKMIQGIRRITT